MGLKLYLEGVDEPSEEDQSLLPVMKQGETLHAKRIVAPSVSVATLPGTQRHHWLKN